MSAAPTWTITPALAASSGETLRQLALAGTGIVCLSDFMTGADHASDALVQVLAKERSTCAGGSARCATATPSYRRRSLRFRILFRGAWADEAQRAATRGSTEADLIS
ncbi:hypothetical protein [Variovorax sp. DXTD-1]|uniref:hypothetical protein n=1 Tax=Variovorax sp. DXTD-1 TaxID=2495592 RepID=UPI0039180991